MTWLLGLLGYIPGLVSKGLDFYIAKTNGDVTKAVALMTAEQAAISAQKDFAIAAMSHPVWWIAWAIFVIPTGLYYDKILLWDKMFGYYTHGSTPPLTGFVADWAGWIVLGLFGLQVSSGLVGSVLNRIFK